MNANEHKASYTIIRFYRDPNRKQHIVKRGLTLKQAQAHCSDPTTRKEGEWFDGYTDR